MAHWRGDVAAGRALRIGAAHRHVLHVAGIDAGALHGLGDHVPAHVCAMGEVEGAAHGFADGCAGGGYDDGVDHGVASFQSLSQLIRVGVIPGLGPGSTHRSLRRKLMVGSR